MVFHCRENPLWRVHCNLFCHCHSTNTNGTLGARKGSGVWIVTFTPLFTPNLREKERGTTTLFPPFCEFLFTPHSTCFSFPRCFRAGDWNLFEGWGGKRRGGRVFSLLFGFLREFGVSARQKRRGWKGKDRRGYYNLKCKGKNCQQTPTSFLFSFA